jgi:hypothetical protein
MAVEGGRSEFVFVLGLPGGAGALRISAAPPPGATGGVAAALVLAPALGPLTALQRWLGQGFDPIEWVPEPGPHVPGEVLRLQLRLQGADAPGRATLELPLARLPLGRCPPPGLLEAWPTLAAELSLHELPAATLERAGVRDGALLLLPASLGPGGVSLCLRHAGWPSLVLPAWQPGMAAGSLDAARLEPTDLSAATGWRVVFHRPLAVPASAWFGLGGTLPMPTQPPRLCDRAGPVAEGEWVPVGTGWALRLRPLPQTVPG